jgi:hypothetical protein
MKNKLSPQQAYKKVASIAKSCGMSVSEYTESKGVSKSTVSRWKNKKDGKVLLDTLYQLGV